MHCKETFAKIEQTVTRFNSKMAVWSGCRSRINYGFGMCNHLRSVVACNRVGHLQTNAKISISKNTEPV